MTLRHKLRRHAEHIARMAGWDHIGIGSDLDGGFGLEQSPIEIDTVADLHLIGDAVPQMSEQSPQRKLAPLPSKGTPPNGPLKVLPPAHVVTEAPTSRSPRATTPVPHINPH